MSTPSRRIPMGVVERLPQYLKALFHLRGEGVTTASSARLSELAEVNAAEIRRDLAYFGSFGKRGVGYGVPQLIDTIQRILGSDHVRRIAIVGAGNLGTAIASHDGLRTRGFVVSCMFDSDRSRVGHRVGGVVVRDVGEFAEAIAETNVRVGIIAVPSRAAQQTADLMSASGIRVILNYSSTFVSVPEGITVHNTDPIGELLHTLYYLSRSDVVARA